MGSYEDGYASASIRSYSCYGHFPSGVLQPRCNTCEVAVKCHENTKRKNE